MQKKTDTSELDIPKDDIDCWERYPKHRWVYDLSRLLDAQHIGWSPYEVPMHPHRELNMRLESELPIIRQPGFIYTKPTEGDHLTSEVYIAKGEIKLIRHFDPKTGKELPNLVGEVELRLNAFVTLHFAKFTGVITCETHGHDIYRIQLRAYSDLSLTTDSEIIKLTKRIYKRTETTLNGLTDRILHESLAS
jgi:hypothetical protein